MGGQRSESQKEGCTERVKGTEKRNAENNQEIISTFIIM